MRSLTVAWNDGVAVFPLAEGDLRSVEEVAEDFRAHAQLYVDEDDPSAPGLTICDRCGDMSNSPPDLPCGRMEYSKATGLPITGPCTGVYHRATESSPPIPLSGV